MKSLYLTVSCEQLEAIRAGRQTVVSKPVRSLSWIDPESMRFSEVVVLAGSANQLHKNLRLEFPFRGMKRVSLAGQPDCFEVEVRG